MKSYPLLNTALVALGTLVLARTANAQVYTHTQYSAPFVPLSGATVLSVGSSDDGAAMVPIGFSFPYFGATFTHLNVGVNGLAWFALPCSMVCFARESCDANTNLCRAVTSPYAPDSLPSEIDPRAMIAMFWDDLDLGSAPRGDVLSQVSGTAPNRVLAIEWRSLRALSGNSASRVSFQLRLFEGGRITMHYAAPTGADDDEWNGAIGVENLAENEAIVPLACAQPDPECTWTDLVGLSNQVIEIGPASGPELVGELLAPSGGAAGAAVDLGLRVRNIGTEATTSSFFVDLYFSSTATIGAQDRLLSRVTVGPVAAGATASSTVSVTVPNDLVPGVYRFGAQIDATNVVPEASDANNVAVSAPFLMGPDFAIDVTAPNRGGAGEPLTATLQVLSRGAPMSSAAYAVYLSSDETYDANDALIASGTAQLNGASQVSVQATGTLPANAAPGTYSVIARVDPNGQISEVDENNNTDVSGKIVLTGPDVAALEVSGGEVAFRGRPYRISVSLRNEGGQRALRFFYSLHFSDNALITTSDPLLGEFGPVDLMPGEGLRRTHDVVVSTTAAVGAFVLGLIADSTGVIPEDAAHQANNIARKSSPVIVRDVVPDFTVSDVRVSIAGAAGERMAVERALSNLGPVAGTAAYNVYVSSDATIEPARDRLVGSGTENLSPNQNVTRADLVTIPFDLAAGSYFVGYVVDPNAVVDEIDETNNVAASTDTVRIAPGQLSVVTTQAPPATVGVPYAFDLAARGGSGTYTWSKVGGELPRGLRLEGSTGQIRGTPEREGSFPVAFEVVDNGLRSRVELTFVVRESTIDLAIITRAVPPAFIGRPYSFRLVAIGGAPPYVWAPRGALPPGLRLEGDGHLLGTGSAASSQTVDVAVADALGATKNAVLTIRVVDPRDAVRFGGEALADGTVHVAYSEELRLVNGVSPFGFDLVDGAFPAGLGLVACQVPSGFCLAGTPTEVGVSTFALRVTDSRLDTDTNRFTIEVSPADGIHFATTSLPSGVRGEAYLNGGSPVRLLTVAKNGGDVAFRVLQGNLPGGLELLTSGEIKGTPTASGLYAFVVVAKNNAGEVAYRGFAIAIDEPAEPIVRPEKTGCGCMNSRGRTPSASWAVGLTLFAVVLAARRALRGRVVLLLGALILMSATDARAAAPYVYTTLNVPYATRSGGTTLNFSPSTDDGVAQVNLPFRFRFFDDEYEQVSVSTNGLVTFGSASDDYDNTLIPDPASPNAFMALLWDDLTQPTGTVHVEGSEPNRVVIIQWENVRGLGDTNGRMRFQLWLYEGASARFEFRYGATTDLRLGGYSASVGFENRDGTLGHSFLACTAVCNTADIVALSGRVFRAERDAGPDIVAASVRGPARVFQNQPFAVDIDVASGHPNPLGPFVYTIHFVPVSALESDRPIFTSSAITLGAYENRRASHSVQVDATVPPGRYRLRLEADSQGALVEPSEDNNVVWAKIDTVVGENQADFLCESLSATPATLAPGDVLFMQATLRNAGNVPAQADFRMVLSANNVISLDDRVVHTGSAAVSAGQSLVRNVQVALPTDLASGPYYVGMILDPDSNVAEWSDLNNSCASSTPILLRKEALELATTSIPGGYVGVPYTTFLTARGGDGTYEWDIVSGGNLPLGLLLLANTGEIRGVPREAAATTLTFRVKSAGREATKAIPIRMDTMRGPLTIVTRALEPAVLGQPYPPSLDQRVRAVNGTGTVTFSLAGRAPAGLVFEPDGFLHGVATEPGDFELSVTASDGTSSATRALALTVAEPGRLTIVAEILEDWPVAKSYGHQLRVVGDDHLPTSSVAFSLVNSDSLPPGLALTETGQLVGSPTTVGRKRFLVKATQGDGALAAEDTASFSLRIVDDDGLRITTRSLPIGSINEPYNARIESSGGTLPLVWRLEFAGDQTLPHPLSWRTETVGDRDVLAITGTPERATDMETGPGAIGLVVSVTDAAGRYSAMPLALRIAAPTPTLPVTPPASGCSCSARRFGVSNAAWIGGGFMLVGCWFIVLWRRRERA